MFDKLQGFADGSAELPDEDDEDAECVRQVVDNIALHMYWFKADKESFWDNYFKETRIGRVRQHLTQLKSESESEDAKKWHNESLHRMWTKNTDDTTKRFDIMWRFLHPFGKMEERVL